MMVGIMTNVDSTTPSWDFRKEIVKRATDCVAERCVAERCVAERCVAERCVAERCVAERCVAERCVAERERERELTDIVHGVERAAKYR